MMIRAEACPKGRRGKTRKVSTAIATLLGIWTASCSVGVGDGSGFVPPFEEETSDLVLTPTNALNSSGFEGGPFSPASMVYTVTNGGTDPVDWTASVDQPWVTLSSAGGTLDAGAQTNLTVSINQTAAAALGLGTHGATVSVVDVGLASTQTRPVSLQVNASAPTGNTSTSLTQFGITWFFDRSYEVGQFANGDWWVVGPVTITSITPKSQKVSGRTMNGAMINPSPALGWTQGYDSSMYAQYKGTGSYNSEVNAALNVSASNPLVLAPHSSLLSTISLSAPDVRPQIKTCAVLTVLPTAAAPGSFRPAYSGTDKTIRYNESQLSYSLLEKLPIGGGIVSLAEAERMFERPWIEHVPAWIGRYTHPSDNMPDYGRDIADHVGVGAMMLHLDYSNAQKRTLLVRFVQLGIDLYGIAQNGGHVNWRAAAGHMSGRKWPILFAGLMLGDANMSNIGFDPIMEFGEDGQTFYVEETSPGVYNYGFGGYTASSVGTPEWGTAHSFKPESDDSDWNGDPYRQCCSANSWWGQLLAAHVMGARTLWNNQALFDYQDRYLTEMTARKLTDWRLAWRGELLTLWKAHRSKY